MHFLKTNEPQPKHDLAYWTDVVLAGLGMLCIVEVIGRFLDWLKSHKPVDAKIAFGFLIGFGVLLLLSPRRFNFLVTSLLALAACGAFNAIVMQTLLGLPVILACVLAVYLLLRWKGHLLK